MNEKSSGNKAQITIAIIGLIGVVATGIFSNWDKIFNTFKPKEDIHQVTPVPNNGNQDNESGLSGRYTMDKQTNRIIIISKLVGNEYRIEEVTSPWPWTGSAVLSGSNLSGRAHFPKSKATMKVEGTLRGDGSIDINYHFITAGDGSDSERIDHHVWFPE